MLIINYILNPAFDAATQGYLSSFGSVTGRDRNQEFKSDCEKLSKVGEKMSTQLFGQEVPLYIGNEWKKRRYDFDAWIRENGMFRSITIPN